MELFKTANAQTSFICEASLERRADNGKIYNKIAMILVLRDEKNKAVKTLKYYLDVPAAKVLFFDLWEDKFNKKYTEFKRNPKMERALTITLQETGLYQVSVLNVSKKPEEKLNLYFNLNRFQIRHLSISVLDYLKNHELALMLAQLLHNN